MGRNSGRQESKQLFREQDVVAIPLKGKDGVVEYRPALITNVGGDGSTYSSEINYAFIEGDGGLGHGGHAQPWNTEGWKHIDFCKVRTVVDLPPEWEKVATDFDKRWQDSREKDRERMEEDEPETHPSYATVNVSRVQGSASLFMSPFTHQHYMTLSIGRATRYRGLSNDRVFGGMSELIQVALSEAQWAKMVSSAGNGSGTPATLTRLGGSLVQECPQQADLHRFHDDVQKRMDKAAEAITAAVEKAEALLASKSATKGEREALLGEIRKAKNQMTDGMPFVIKQLEERMEHIVTEGKIEIENFAQRTVHQMGLQAVAGQVPQLTPVALTLKAETVDPYAGLKALALKGCADPGEGGCIPQCDSCGAKAALKKAGIDW